MLIIEAGADSCAPQSGRDRLWHASGGPNGSPIATITAWHLGMTFLGGYDLQRQVYSFLDRTLARRSNLRLTEEEGAPAGRARAGAG